MNVVSWFEIPVKDMTRARAFYNKVLGHTPSDLPSPIPGVEMAATLSGRGDSSRTSSTPRATALASLRPSER